MGSAASKLRDVWDAFWDKPMKITMVGMYGAGRTTILYKLKLNKLITTIPTIGINVETVKPRHDLTLKIWDIGGGSKIRELWHHWCKDAEGLIFVVDSSDEEQFPEVKEDLHNLFKHDSLSQLPILVLANKQDLPNAKSTTAVAEALDMAALSTTHKYHIQECCAITGEGLNEGFACFANLLRKHKECSQEGVH